ncbi:MAG: hypothetical protein JNK20_01040 [Flavipsychrobacter sp.]|nr:hypothetical protein [Flavipsychrobacter sp.]
MVKRLIITFFVSLAFFLWQFHGFTPHHHTSKHDHHSKNYDKDADHDSPFDGFGHQEDFEKNVILSKAIYETDETQQLLDLDVGRCFGFGVVNASVFLSQRWLPARLSRYRQPFFWAPACYRGPPTVS